MSAPAGKFGRGRLVIKYLMVMLPLFLACTTAGLFYIADRSAQNAKDELNARLGTQSASMAGTLEQLFISGDIGTAQKLLNTLLSDRAIECAEVVGQQNAARSIKAPQGLGCRGVDDTNMVEIAMGEEAHAMLHIRYNTHEVDTVVRNQREFTILALVSSLIIAIAASCIGFGVIIGRPLKELLAAIHISSQTGKKSEILRIPNDELGRVIQAYNDMQTRLANEADSLTAEVQQRIATEEELRTAKLRVETSKTVLEDQFDQIELQRDELKTILDNMPHSVIWLDKDRKIRMRSGRVTEVHCMKEEEYQHVTTFYDHVRIVGLRGDLGAYDNEDELAALVNERVELLSTEKDINKAIRINFPSTGRWMQVRVAALPDGGCILGQHDITGQVAAEQAVEQARMELEEANNVLEARVEERTRDLIKLQESLVESERHATYGKLVSKICHELRNPLNAQSLALHAMRSKFGDDPRLASLFERSERSLKRCTAILDDFHDFAITADFNLKVIDVCEWTSTQVQRIATTHDVVVETNIAEGPVYCNVDEAELSKAFAKVAKNAVQAVTEDERTGSEKRVSIKLSQASNEVKIEVVDFGIGMCNDTADRALQPLFSTRNFGVGLGLPIARQCLERHGGGLSINSRPGDRTTVTLWLPAAPPVKMAG